MLFPHSDRSAAQHPRQPGGSIVTAHVQFFTWLSAGRELYPAAGARERIREDRFTLTQQHDPRRMERHFNWPSCFTEKKGI